jgi:HEAT repeat protein
MGIPCNCGAERSKLERRYEHDQERPHSWVEVTRGETGVSSPGANCFVLLIAFGALVFPAVSSIGRPDSAQSSLPSVQQSAAAPAAASGSQTSQEPAESKSGVNSDMNLPAAAWTLLAQSVNADSVRVRSDALSALTVIDSDRRAITLIENALDDKDENIRAMAATSLGDVKARSAIPKLKDAMDDKSAAVSFAVAQALWKMGDRSGRDIFYEILDGERKTQPNPIKSKINEAKLEMHDPKALALLGINQVSGAFLGPFSMGVSMLEDFAKDTSAPVQAFCAQLLAADDSHQTVDELTAALDDKHWPVRAAAARSLAKLRYHGAMSQLKDMMENDKSQPVRFVAAAAIIQLSQHHARKPSRN